MDELKLLIDMVAHLPSMALWVLVAFWAYKVVVIGSIYGVVRLFIVKLHSWLTTPKHELRIVDETARVGSLSIQNCRDELIAQLHRVKGKGLTIESDYIHAASVDWLRRAIDAQIAADQAVKP